ncbi:MAG: ribosome biogenesis GTP-binding protein YihA/YsxC [Solobacterium sp.]|jgi:GTP-binding protein|nr:ribosome biogenesis GTP-binding protein YihA/YsxC [Solobacterium sp.]MCH4222430.1 ribosome biogenesis GTP-binding protein YihA/YsxC [Solobacterium sp.]MCH4265296.1 ribosome biogenesis GTP-binding protein YihA/YsxC [Solobacterium sp.]
MQYHEIELLGSAARSDQWPVSDLPELIFAGRSNAGKSSLINGLTNRNNAAYVGKTPGKTKLLNFFEVDQRYVFCDAPGYGYAKGGTYAAVSFGDLLEPYFEQRETLCGMVLVLDIRRVPNDDDLTMVNYARMVHLPVIAACVKSDKLSRSEQNKQLKLITQALNISSSSAVPCSSIKKEGLDAVWKLIHQMTENQKKIV